MIDMEKIRVDEFYNIKGIGNVTFSKDGKTLAFTVSNVNKDNNNYESFIYIKKENQAYFKLTAFGQEGSFQFLDNENIIFNANRKPKEGEFGSKFYKININGGEADLYLEFPINVVYVKKLENGDFICLANNDPLFENKKILKDKKLISKYQSYMKENADYEVFNEVPFYYNGSGFTRGNKMNLYYYKTESKELEELTSIKYNVFEFEINEAENNIFFTANTEKDFISLRHNNVYVLDLKTRKIEKIIDYKNINCEGIIAYKNGFYFGGCHNETGLNTDPDFYYYDNDKKKYDKICDFGFAPWNTVGTDIRITGGSQWKVADDGSLYFVCTYYDSAYLYQLKEGKINKIIERDGAVECFDIAGDKIVLVGLYDMMPQELYEYKNNELNKISNFNDYLKDYYLAFADEIIFKSVNDDIHGFVLKPYNYDENKTYPVILDVHGGPKTVYGKVFYHEMQYWASEGYFVIYCNPTGSDGRGRKFADMRGNYGQTDFQDIMNFVDECVKKYKNMDKDHIYETGGSYGGFMTNWIIGHTDRFKACASQRSISNWISFYGTSDIGVEFACDQTAGDIWENFDKMWYHSPLKYAKNVKTPTLFIHSNEDYRCPMEQGMQMYTALKANGIDTKFVYFKGENHELSRHGKPSHRLKRLNEITNWFKMHK